MKFIQKISYILTHPKCDGCGKRKKQSELKTDGCGTAILLCQKCWDKLDSNYYD